MHLNRFDLNLLIALDALLHERHVTRAAERVFLSQPAMSLALRRLREYFNDPLLVRVGRVLQPTPRGLALIEPVRETLLRAQTVLGTQPTFDAMTVKRAFTVVIPDFAVPWLVPKLLRQLSVIAPGVRLQLEKWSSTGLNRLTYGDIDFFITLDGPGPSAEPDTSDSILSTALQTIRWVCAASADHPKLGGELSREEFLSLPHVYVRMPGDELPLDGVVRQLWHAELDVRAITENVLEVPFMIRGTPLIAVVPENLALQLGGGLPIRVLELPPGLLPRRRICLKWHRRSEPDPGHAWLRDLIVATSRGP